ncbi:MAG: hypothetical protein RMY29_018760 [Nostoc sp. CreGUA01]
MSIGHWALGIGHWELGILTSAPCPLPPFLSLISLISPISRSAHFPKLR